MAKRGAWRLSSATDDNLGGSSTRSADMVKVRQYGKTCKELTGMFMTQELAMHSGSVWCINFSLAGRYLASTGEDRVIHVWEVSEGERKGELLGEGAVSEESGSGGSLFVAVAGNGSRWWQCRRSAVQTRDMWRRRGGHGCRAAASLSVLIIWLCPNACLGSEISHFARPWGTPLMFLIYKMLIASALG
ncbi:hypothetical protein CFC21_040012 [Triticum aestivum]|uniref:Uncharacterized protein n=2 Tax=Triticum aestivum TaxID=4565 RepID=A0A3B6FGL6_WHEAT|nr:hypothetical protein CFC21_040012 [Triticum aestivum]